VTPGTAVVAPDERSHAAPSAAWSLAPLAVGLGSLCIGAVALGHRSLSTDEAFASSQARGSLADVLSRIVHDTPGSAGHLLLVRLAHTVGTDEAHLRAPSVVAVALACALLVVLGTMLLGRVGGLVAGIALAANAGVIEAARDARPVALGLFGVVLATLLFVVALERGGGWRWAPYAVAAAALPLTHPLAASVLAAHGAALLARRDRPDLRSAGIALLAGTAIATLLLGWMAADRLDTADGTGGLDLEGVAHGVGRALGWNPVLTAAAAAGLVVLFGSDARRTRLWRGVLVGALVAAPIAVTLLAGIALPVFVGPLVLAAPGAALAAGAAVPLLSPARGLLWAGVAAALVASAVVLALRLTAAPGQDWRALAIAVKRVQQPRETVVVVPDRSRAAFAYYAPDVQTIGRAHGDGAWIAVVAGSPSAAITTARPFVDTPRYALARQFRYGSDLRLQHWIRP
jgi:mannosyltransferase